MRTIEEIPEEKIKEMEYYYDPLVAGICIQKYLETEDGKGDFVPIYANRMFAESMGIPVEMVKQFTLRQVSQEFPEQKLQDMVEVAFDGRVIVGDSFSRDYSKYFSVWMYQYRYGYTIMFMSDVTTGHINANTLHSLSKSYEEIYYASATDPVCSKVYPVTEKRIQNVSYEELITEIVRTHQIKEQDIPTINQFFSREDLTRMAETEDCRSIRFRMKTEKEEDRWYMAEVIINERMEGEPRSFVIAIKDIDKIVREETEKRIELEKAYHEAKLANESKDKFLKHMSHDLRTPINGILGMLQILDSETVSDEMRLGYRDKIRSATENLLTIFTEVLEITRLDSANIKFVKTSFDFNQVRKELDGLLSKYDTPFDVNIPQFEHPFRLGAEEYIRQIGRHLIANAVKFNKDNNPIAITVVEKKETNEVVFEVRDQGIGISDEFQEHMFEAFTQEHGDSRTEYVGTGLGLAYVKRIVDEMGGSITCESTLGVGSTFTVTIPVAIDFDREKTQGAASLKRADLAGKRALIVEDNEVNMMIAECFVKTVKMTADKAKNGKIGYEKFISSPVDEYDLILMDIMMPVMNGLEATKAIRESDHPRAKTIPIIAVSANSFPEDIEKGMEDGLTAYISKPLSKSVLYDVMETYLEEEKEL